ncbi:MAG: transcriptional regulator [Acidobacteria bacterium]|nr:transcriptional regulator [Acidobacteriota bacterium]
MKLDAFFAGHPVFTIDEVRAYLERGGEVHPRALEGRLAYHVGEGHLARVRRGLYATVPRGLEGEPLADPYLVASRLATDAIVAYHSALELAGLAYSVHSEVWYLTARRARAIEYGGQTFRPVAHPRALADRGQVAFGVRTLDRQGMTVRVTGIERTLADVLDRPDLAGGWEEAWRSLEAVEYLNPSLVVDYCGLLANSTLAAKVGLFLELHRDTLSVDDRTLAALESMRPAGPHYAFDAKRHASRFVSRWNLLVPAALVDRRWEEPL